MNDTSSGGSASTWACSVRAGRPSTCVASIGLRDWYLAPLSPWKAVISAGVVGMRSQALGGSGVTMERAMQHSSSTSPSSSGLENRRFVGAESTN